MNISVWDTYVKRSDGRIIHFDLLVPDDIINKTRVFDYGQRHLNSKSFKTEGLNVKRCNFCPIEAATSAVIEDIEKRGFSIVELSNCN